MKTYYTEQRAQNYNSIWRNFSSKTQTVVLSLLEAELRQNKQGKGSARRVLDAGCGTGLLLSHLARMLPEADLYGIDASESMLTQARQLLPDKGRVSLSHVSLPVYDSDSFPFAQNFFDIITCTNTLHYASNPAAVLRSLHTILCPDGLLVIEDYTLKRSPFPWYAFEWAIKMYDPQHVKLYTGAEIEEQAAQFGLSTLQSQSFRIDFLCNGWALLLQK